VDLAGFAAAIAHRGVRFVRMPSTVLAQNDAGVGVKNGVNAFGRKNFLGTFAPPFAVVNDFDLLRTLSPRDRRAGLAEAVKVAMIRDATFFESLERDREALRDGETTSLERAIYRCAELHLAHIAQGGDPFEQGSARPLDFGHWSAHRLEEVTAGGLRHGEAVAIGMALDSSYAGRVGLLAPQELERTLRLLAGLGFELYHPALAKLNLGAALEGFREHLGGELTVTLPLGIGHGVEVHAMDLEILKSCIGELAGDRTGRRPSAQPRRGGTDDEHERPELPPPGQ
jgi:3-dehydroquinate synthase